jgi:hypothetical protein
VRLLLSLAAHLNAMSITQTTERYHDRRIPSGVKLNDHLLQLILWFVVIAKLASSLYASIDARGLYADGASYLVGIYGDKWFLTYDVRGTVQILRQAPIVLLSRYTTATLFECGQVFTFVMLTMPTALCALCWFIAPNNRKAWILFPLIALLTGFAATSFHAIGEAAIATSYYWILLFLQLFRCHSAVWQVLFVLLCVPAFWLHEGAFPLTAGLLIAIAVQADAPRRRFFVRVSALLLAAIFTYQLRWVIYPQFPDDRDGIVQGLTHFEFFYVDGHFNLQLINALVGLVALSVVFFPGRQGRSNRKNSSGRLDDLCISDNCRSPNDRREFFSVFASTSLKARYHPIIFSTALGAAMALLLRYQVPEPRWMQPTTIFILVLLCVTQTAADMAATARWDAYVVDLRSRLVHGQGLIPWEANLHTADERVDIN